MIKAIFLDFYGTLVKWHPAAEEIQQEAAAAEGLDVSPVAIDQAYPTANALLDRANAEAPIVTWSPEKRDAFFREYERTLLTTAGYEVTGDTAWRIWERVRAAPKELALYSDVMDGLQALRDEGLTLGVISNMGRDLGPQIAQLGLTDYVSVWVSSAEEGFIKPHPAIFQAGLKKAGVQANEAVHVGDSYESDVTGAQNAGMYPLLLWRERGIEPPADCPTVSRMTDVLPYVKLL